MKIVVTGGAGFIGANLCYELASRLNVGDVVAFDNLSTGSAANLTGSGASLVVGDMLDDATLFDVIDGAHAVVHLAARPSVPRSVADPLASHHANATGTIRVLEACRRVGAPIIVASSSSVYGPTVDLPKRESQATRPQSPYAASKLAAEAYALAYGATYSLPTLAFRFFNVYGPLQSSGHAYAAVIPAFIDAALRGIPLTIHGDGGQSRDFTFVGSVVRVLADAAIRRVSHPSPVNLAFGSRLSILDLVARLAELIGNPLDTVFEAARRGDVRDSQACDGQLRELFPDCAAVSIDDGLKQTLEWFRTLPQYPAVQASVAATC